MSWFLVCDNTVLKTFVHNFILLGRPQTFEHSSVQHYLNSIRYNDSGRSYGDKPPRVRRGQKSWYAGHSKTISAARDSIKKQYEGKEPISDKPVRVTIRACGL